MLKTRDLSYYEDSIQDLVRKEEDLDSAILIQKKRNDSLYAFYKKFYDDPVGDLLDILKLDKKYAKEIEASRKNEKLLSCEKVYDRLFGCSYLEGLRLVLDDFREKDLNIVLPREDTDMLTEDEKERYYAALILENQLFRERVEVINGTTLAFLMSDACLLTGKDVDEELHLLDQFSIREGILEHIQTQVRELMKKV